MFIYEKKLQYPVKIANTNPKLAAAIISQYGGPYIISLQKRRCPYQVLSLFVSPPLQCDSSRSGTWK